MNPRVQPPLLDDIDVELGEAYYGAQKAYEDKLTTETIDLIKEYIARRFRQGRRPALRDAHTKDNGCVQAIFRVDPNIKPDLKVGVFSSPGHEYNAWIRFSNGSSERQNSRFPDARGMAIKLMGVEGPKLLDAVDPEGEKHTQDFVLISSPAFFADDLVRYNNTLRQFLSGGTIAQYLSVLNLRGKEIWIAIKVNLTLLTNPLFHQYWSMTPYRLGLPPGPRYAVKYTVKPCAPDSASLLAQVGTFLRRGFSLKEQMNRTLAEREVSFDFFIQRFVDDKNTPVEDTKVVWHESVSVPERVGTLTIPRQDLMCAERAAFCENLSFSPWHGLLEHKPLGAINRVRRRVYLAISKYRHELNQVPRREPTGGEAVCPPPPAPAVPSGAQTAKRAILSSIAVIVLGLALFTTVFQQPRPGHVLDEAARAGFPPDHFLRSYANDEGYLDRMDNGELNTPEQKRGRITWMIWTGGNDRFWNTITSNTFGTFDLLKTISSHPSLKFAHNNRFKYLGVMNEPCYERAQGPDPKRFNLWLDTLAPGCEADPFADATNYPGVKIGARGDGELPVGSYYGEPTGIVGLRLFPNPDFDATARKNWNAERYYTDENYYMDQRLVRPYRVGMACAFCHVGPNPRNPPSDPEHPGWANLNSTVGAQYLWLDRVFNWQGDDNNVIFQLLHTGRPGTFDTSLVSTDNIVNPRTMNAVYNLNARMTQALRFGHEHLAGGELNNKQFNDFPQAKDLDSFYQKPYVDTPRILKDGSDAVGALGALNRVYINIGLFSEEWLLHFQAFLGTSRISPIPIATAERNSVYWKATELKTVDMARFLLQAGNPDYLNVAMGNDSPLPDQPLLDRGKTVFAENCARCHSSKLPDQVVGMQLPNGDRKDCMGPNYLACWNEYWAWTQTDGFKRQMVEIVKDPDFLKGNFLSTEFRVPVTLLQTNACSPLAMNALANNIWDNFSSQSYKELPAVGAISYHDPFDGSTQSYTMPAGGRGYTRPASLVSLWSTAPYLLNNTVGQFSEDPSVAGRMKDFDEAIHQMLWPNNRRHDPVLGERVGWIMRTDDQSWIKLPRGYLPGWLTALRAPINWFFPGAMNDAGDFWLGPIPQGTPIALIGSLAPMPESTDLWSKLKRDWALLGIGWKLHRYMGSVTPTTSNADAQRLFEPVARAMYALSNCPDFEVNRGHYFGTDLSDPDKTALIAFLKTL